MIRGGHVDVSILGVRNFYSLNSFNRLTYWIDRPFKSPPTAILQTIWFPVKCSRAWAAPWIWSRIRITPKSSSLLVTLLKTDLLKSFQSATCPWLGQGVSAQSSLTWWGPHLYIADLYCPASVNEWFSVFSRLTERKANWLWQSWLPVLISKKWRRKQTHHSKLRQTWRVWSNLDLSMVSEHTVRPVRIPTKERHRS